MEYNGIKVLVSEGAFKEYKNEELKDIMEYLEDPDIYVEEHDYCYKRLSLNETNILLDYITDSQNEIKDLEDTIQNKNNCIEAYDCIIEARDERIDKAIKYILQNFCCDKRYKYSSEDIYKIIGILTGEE